MRNKEPKKGNLVIFAGKVNLTNYNFKYNEFLFNIGNSLAFEKNFKN